MVFLAISTVERRSAASIRKDGPDTLTAPTTVPSEELVLEKRGRDCDRWEDRRDRERQPAPGGQV